MKNQYQKPGCAENAIPAESPFSSVFPSGDCAFGVVPKARKDLREAQCGKRERVFRLGKPAWQAAREMRQIHLRKQRETRDERESEWDRVGESKEESRVERVCVREWNQAVCKRQRLPLACFCEEDSPSDCARVFV